MQHACCFDASLLTCRQHCWMACFTALTMSSMSSAAGSNRSCRQPRSHLQGQTGCTGLEGSGIKAGVADMSAHRQPPHALTCQQHCL